VPSRCFEGFPRVIAEAFAHGRPVLASRLGSLATIVNDETGRQFEASASGWAAGLDALGRLDVAAMGLAARAEWERRLSPAASMASLLAVYADLTPAQAG
jgi:glycosyltransferase involved in cell wall biosynthesis